AEVADTRQGDRHETIEELIHAGATQRHHAADGVALAALEASDRLAGLRHHRLLPGDLGHVTHRVIHDLLVGHRLAHAHVERDLGDARHLHHRLVTGLGGQVGDDLLAILLLQASHVSYPLSFVKALRLHDLVVGLEEANLLPALERPDAHPITLATRRIEQHHIGLI